MLVCAQCAKVFMEEGLDRCPDDGSPLYEVGEAAPDAVVLAPGAVVAEKFTLVHELPRRSGAGRTWIAHQTALDRHVELRILPKECVRGPADEARFQREVGIWAKLKSDHVARLFDSGFTADGAPYMAVELMQGGLASDALRAEGPLSWPRWQAVALQSLEGLVAAHEAGILHRDVTPDALVLGERPDGALHVRLTGFGLAKLLAGGDDDPTAITGTGLFIGNPVYMAPEWMMKGIVGVQTDIFALGITLYELACGARPVLVTNNSEALAAYVKGKPTPPKDHRKDTPPKVARWLEKIIQFDPEKRFKTAKEALDALHLACAPDVGPVLLPETTPPPVRPVHAPLPENWVVWAVLATGVITMAILVVALVTD
ncbi:serine/threonine protein kinase [Myxococcota bacterium]|nr:serine/threonine protein kinase [Myxococcota bacterium]